MGKRSKVPSLKSFRLLPGESWIGGVCAGVAYWLSIPLWIVRLIWGLAFFVYGVGLLPYLALWCFVPSAVETPADFEKRTGG